MNGESVLGLAQAVRDASITALVRGSFAGFGAHSRLCGPVRLVGVARMEVGSHVYVGSGCWLQTVSDPEQASEAVALRLGDRVTISGHVVLSAAREVVLEEGVLIARGCYLADHTHGTAHRDIPIRDQGITGVAPVRIRAGAWLGQNVVIMPGVDVGAGAVVGANSVVTEDVPPRAVAVGAPARVVRQLP